MNIKQSINHIQNNLMFMYLNSHPYSCTLINKYTPLIYNRNDKQ